MPAARTHTQKHTHTQWHDNCMSTLKAGLPLFMEEGLGRGQFVKTRNVYY